jgi:hypothetical protein
MRVSIGDPNINNSSDVIWKDGIEKSIIKNSRYKWSIDIADSHKCLSFI